MRNNDSIKKNLKNIIYNFLSLLNVQKTSNMNIYNELLLKQNLNNLFELKINYLYNQHLNYVNQNFKNSKIKDLINENEANFKQYIFKNTNVIEKIILVSDNLDRIFNIINKDK